MDALSDVLKTVRLEGAFYLDTEFTAPWCIRGKYGQASVRERLAGTYSPGRPEGRVKAGRG